MTRSHSARQAAETTKVSVRHAAQVVTPYAGAVRGSAVHYADEARRRLGPKVSHAADYARETTRAGYGSHLAPRIAQAREAVPEMVAASAEAAARRTRQTARQAAQHTRPLVEQAVETARVRTEPVREEAAARSAAALAVLRGRVSATDVEKLARRHNRQNQAGRIAQRVTVLSALAGAGFALWRWWNQQTNPEWLVDVPPPAAGSDASGVTAADLSEEPGSEP